MNEKLSREELVDLVKKIMAVDGTQDELDQFIDLLIKNVPHPEVTNLIYYPPDGKDFTAEEIIDLALGYKPIIIPPSNSN
jgi:hypothetical protein